MPKISILIPTYKPSPQYLREAIDSLLAQTEQDFEVIVCDEGVGGNPKDILNTDDPRFQFFTNPSPLGIGGNWNACLAKASSPHIQFLFQDDIWEPEYLATGIQILDTYQNIGLVSMNHKYVFEGAIKTESAYLELKATKESWMPEGEQNGKHFLQTWIKRELHPNLVGEPPFVMLRKSVVDKVGMFNTQMQQFLDVEYWLRMLLVSDLYYEPKELGAFRVHSEGASAQNSAAGKGVFDRFSCFQKLTDLLKGDPLQSEVIAARNSALDDMALKFLKRAQQKQQVNTSGSGAFKAFCMRHPLLVYKAFKRAQKNLSVQ